tara:strand:+ start:750 stop:926 length:177 start_codon:yes stop_codon:yes gene_type:complete
MLLAWVCALIASLGFRYWGLNHPDPFIIRPFMVWSLLFGPSIVLGFWLVIVGFRNFEN